MTKATHIRVGGSWKQVNNVWLRVSGEWKEQVIPQVRVSGSWKECMEYGPPPKSLIKYGKLYRWIDLNFAKVFITGMHVASDAEWDILEDYIDDEYNNSPNDFGVGNHLKHPRKDGTPVLSSEYNTSVHPRWRVHSTLYGRDTVNFSTLPGGARLTNGSYIATGNYGYWWSATEFSGTNSLGRRMGSSDDYVLRHNYNKGIGFSLRCVRAATAGEQTLSDGVIVRQAQDYNKNIYDLVKIGTQVWTRQNIAATKYTDGTSVTCLDYDDDDSNTFFANEEDSIW